MKFRNIVESNTGNKTYDETTLYLEPSDTIRPLIDHVILGEHNEEIRGLNISL